MIRTKIQALTLFSTLAIQLTTAPASVAQPVAAVADAAEVEVPAALRSARATMRTFLEGIVRGAQEDRTELIDQAVECLDLSGLPAGARSELGRDLAIQLKEVIDRVRFVEYGQIPDVTKGPKWVFEEVPALKTEIAISRVADGRWLFSAETVSAIPDLYEHFEDKATVHGAMDSAIALSPALWLRSKMPAELTARWFLMENWQWLALAILLGLGWIVGRLIRALLTGPVNRRLEKRELRVPSELIRRVLQPLGLIAMSLVWVIGIGWLGLSPSVASVAIVVFKFIAAFGVIRVAMRVINVVTWLLGERAKATPSKFDDLAVPFFNKTAKVVVFSIGILFMADVFGISPASLLAGLGLGGLAVALAAQDTVKNLFGSFTVILDRPFEVGDGVKIGGGIEGTVEEVGFRSTRVRSWDNTLITVPNGNLISANVENLGNRTFFRYRATLGLTYDTPPERVDGFCRGVEELIRRHPEARQEGYFCRFTDFGSTSLDLTVNCHFKVVTTVEFLDAKHRLLLNIIGLADRMAVGFAFPTQTLHLMKAGEAPIAPHRLMTPRAEYDSTIAAALDAAATISDSAAHRATLPPPPPPPAPQGGEGI